MIENLEDEKSLDFSNLNDGKWKTACLFGDYTNPSYFMKKYGNIGWVDYLYQPMKAWPIIRLSQVEEHEAMIAYVDQINDTHFIHFESGSTKTERGLEHISKCTNRDAPKLEDIWN